ncbi:MAG: hypothetical protein ACR2KK_17040, partial [Acidimicrobiales bacterium]
MNMMDVPSDPGERGVADDFKRGSGEPSTGSRLRELFGFEFDQDVVFVLPTLLAGSPPRPAVAIEDVHAIEALSKALVAGAPLRGLNIEVEFADDLYFLDDLGAVNRHLVSICSPHRNTFTGSVLTHQVTRARFSCFFNEARKPGSGGKHGRFLTVDRRTYWSLDDTPHEDYALIARIPNPWFPTTSIVVLAGTRGVGTWGAGEFLRTSSSDLFAHTEGRDFAAVVEVRYEKGQVIPSLADSVAVYDNNASRAPSKGRRSTRQARSGEPGRDAFVGQDGDGDGALIDRPDPAIWGSDVDAPGDNVLTMHSRRASNESFSLEGALSLDQVAELLQIEPAAVSELVEAQQLLAVKRAGKDQYPYWQFLIGPAGASVFHAMGELVAGYPNDAVGLCRWAEQPNARLANRSPAESKHSGPRDLLIRAESEDPPLSARGRVDRGNGGGAGAGRHCRG